MKILITGANGQLGTDLVHVLSNHHQVYGFTRKMMDVTDLQKVQEMTDQIQPDIVIHSAAYTQVDQAENERDKAYLVNAYGTRNVTVAARQVGAKLIYISTDYVFDGQSSIPLTEFDFPRPLNIYGKSKLAGEEMVKTLTNKYFIVRTSWLYGNHGNNFVKTMLELARKQNEVSVVDDQVGSPTYTMDIAYFLKELMGTEKYGIYHASNADYCSRYEFTKAIYEEAGLKNIHVVSVKSSDFPMPAQRPAYSVLDHLAIRLNGFAEFRHWKEALKDFIRSYDCSNRATIWIS